MSINLNPNRRVTTAAQVGERLLDIIPVVIARTGGLANPLFAVGFLIVGYLTKASFISHVMNDLFLVRPFESL